MLNHYGTDPDPKERGVKTLRDYSDEEIQTEMERRAYAQQSERRILVELEVKTCREGEGCDLSCPYLGVSSPHQISPAGQIQIHECLAWGCRLDEVSRDPKIGPVREGRCNIAEKYALRVECPDEGVTFHRISPARGFRKEISRLHEQLGTRRSDG